MEEEFTKYRSPLEYARVIFRRKWYFITPIFLGVVLSIVACFTLPPTYESGTFILVEEEKIINYNGYYNPRTCAKATKEGVVRIPSAFSITLDSFPNI